jgi:hypothetical protein
MRATNRIVAATPTAITAENRCGVRIRAEPMVTADYARQ